MDKSFLVFQVLYPRSGSLQFVKDFRSPLVDKAADHVFSFGNTFQHTEPATGNPMIYAAVPGYNRSAILLPLT